MITFELGDNLAQDAVIKVIGVGGGGGNAVEHMMRQNISGVEFLCANTDAQALKNSSAQILIQLGNNITKGLGAGANPDVGRQAAQEDRDRIAEVLSGADMVFITAGMGGGTGTGAAPVVAQIARELGILTVAVVTRPFSFEGNKRKQTAEQGIAELAQQVDSLIIVPNEKLLSVLGKSTSLLDAFKAANNVLLGAVQGIAELITRPGLINVDFADVRTVMREMGMAMMGTGVAKGENRAREAAESAIASPLLEEMNLSGARGVLVNITAGLDMGIGEFEEVGEVIKSFTSDDATVVVGTVIDPDMSDEMRVTVVATGLGRENESGVGSLGYHSLHQPLNHHATHQAQTITKTHARLKEHAKLDSGMDNNSRTERSTPVRRQVTQTRVPATTATDVDYLDIPAFLRRQSE
jgi:cell division protein FtsZ